MAEDHLFEAVDGEFFGLLVFLLGDAVGVERENVAGLQSDLNIRVVGFGQNSEDRAGFCEEFGFARRRMQEYGRVVASAGVTEAAGGLVEAGIEHGDEGGGVGDLLEDAVEVLHDLGWSAEFEGSEVEGHGQRRHEQGGGGSRAVDIGDDDVDYIVGYL